jgi:hypothetical protein
MASFVSSFVNHFTGVLVEKPKRSAKMNVFVALMYVILGDRYAGRSNAVTECGDFQWDRETLPQG